jgi:hypothetical protein
MGKIKTVHLRDQDIEIIAYLDGLRNFSEWVRQKAANDIAKQKTGLDPEIVAYIDRILDVKLAACTLSAGQPKEELQNAEDAVKNDIEKMF